MSSQAQPTTVIAGLNTRLIVGLEIHVELNTRTKMWTGAPNVAHPDYYDAEPNTLCDPVVVGMPGTLPVMNKKAMEMSILVGLALNGGISNYTKWDRKSYYYPDLPKNYQISQYDKPLCNEGFLEVPVGASDDAGGAGESMRKVRIIRAHLEEDAGKLMHEAPGGVPIDYSIVDLNRAGTPLLEIVSYPDMHTADQVIAFCQAVRDICRTLRVSQCIMQRGHMRFEPNINVIIEKDGQEYKTPIVEIKNLNSFKAVHGAVLYEHERQVDQWLETGKILRPGSKETRGWDDVRLATIAQREKEDESDYRYFPDPDLLPLVVSDELIESIRAQIPELPLARKRRYIKDLGLGIKNADAIIDDLALMDLFEQVLATGLGAERAASLLLNYGVKRANERGCGIGDLGINPQQIYDIAKLADTDTISSSAADELFNFCIDSDLSATALAQRNSLMQVSDTGELEGFVDQVLADAKNQRIVDDIKGGKGKAIGALMGQIMKLSKGKANPKVVTEMIKSKLG
jgi:aspartyl-tRNA(Asn)/glutamyl-tRNA(Gln) amidotransferase subunit B